MKYSSSNLTLLDKIICGLNVDLLITINESVVCISFHIRLFLIDLSNANLNNELTDPM